MGGCVEEGGKGEMGRVGRGRGRGEESEIFLFGGRGEPDGISI